MKTEEIIQILNAEIKFSRYTPLADQLSAEYVGGFIDGLKQAKFLIRTAEETEVRAEQVARDEVINMLDHINKIKPNSLNFSSGTSNSSSNITYYIPKKPEPIPDLERILEKYDGIIITGARGSGKTETAMKIINYIMESGKTKQGIFIFPTANMAVGTAKSSEYGDLFHAKYHPSYGMFAWSNSVQGRLISSENPHAMRGMQSGLLWLEEVGNFAKPKPNDVSPSIFDHAAFGHRLDYRKVIITGTEYKDAIKGTWLEKLNLYTYNLNTPI